MAGRAFASTHASARGLGSRQAPAPPSHLHVHVVETLNAIYVWPAKHLAPHNLIRSRPDPDRKQEPHYSVGQPAQKFRFVDTVRPHSNALVHKSLIECEARTHLFSFCPRTYRPHLVTTCGHGIVLLRALPAQRAPCPRRVRRPPVHRRHHGRPAGGVPAGARRAAAHEGGPRTPTGAANPKP